MMRQSNISETKTKGVRTPNLCVRRQRQYCCATFSYVNRPALL
uniref:Uncharacterized protein n=1 Tax=Anguilla anguilla TaxID=7936 RepID=A0A0E9VS69_ANGAN